MKQYRAGSIIASSYNSGLVVFLYDESFSDTINEASPKILEYFDDESHEDPALKKLAEDGMLVVYSLAQDDELAVEVSVGPPLSDEEQKEFPSKRPPAKALLKLPTGRLCIEGYDSLRLGPEAEYNEEEGSVVEVPPGDYTLTLYREDPFYGRDMDVDYDESEMSEEFPDDEELTDYDDYGENEGSVRPTQVITLSSPEQVAPPDERPAMLLYGAD